MFEPNEAYHTEGFELAPAGASAADAGIAGRLVARRDRRAFAGRTAGFGTRASRASFCGTAFADAPGATRFATENASPFLRFRHNP